MEDHFAAVAKYYMDWQSLFPDKTPTLAMDAVLSFGESAADYPKLINTDIIAPLRRGWLELSGADCRKFLQGQVTCDIEKLTDKNLLRGAHCTPKGRMVFTFVATAPRENSVRMLLAPDITAAAHAALKKYGVFFKTQIADVSRNFLCLAMAGPGIPDKLQKICGQPLEVDSRHIVDSCELLRTGDQYFLLTGEADKLMYFLHRNKLDAVLVGEPLAHLHSINAGIAEVTESTREMFIPQMLNLDAQNYISFRKGCYTGQEIVARAHYRGAVKRRMYLIKLSGQTLPLAGAEIRDAQQKVIGNIAASAFADEGEIRALAVLTDSNEACETLIIDNAATKTTFLTLPYQISPAV